MEFGFRKCDIFVLKRGRVVGNEGIKFPNGVRVVEIDKMKEN